MSFLQGYARKLGITEYLGNWNASTNTPSLQNGQGQKNGYYIVEVSGNTSIDGINVWAVGDWIMFNGSTWEKIDNQNNMDTNAFLDGGTPDAIFDSGVTIDGGSV